jgi:subtilisin family serine protease
MNVKIPQYASKLLLKKDAKEVSDWAYNLYLFDLLHELGYKGQGQVIAILDTGWNNNHPDLIDPTIKKKGNYYEGETIIHVEDMRGQKDPFDRNFHSTWIHGCIGASHNGFGVKGRLPEAKIIILKVMDDDGGGDITVISNAIYRAVDLGATDINLSIGISSSVPVLRDACNFAYQKGVWIHGAAGNDGGNPIDYPAKYDSVLSWGSHNKEKKRSSFSDLGESLDLYSAGEDVLSCFGNSDYALNSGTSMATPNGLCSVVVHRQALEPKLGRALNYDDLELIVSIIDELNEYG